MNSNAPELTDEIYESIVETLIKENLCRSAKDLNSKLGTTSDDTAFFDVDRETWRERFNVPLSHWKRENSGRLTGTTRIENIPYPKLKKHLAKLYRGSFPEACLASTINQIYTSFGK